MNKAGNNPKRNKLENALNDVYSEDVFMDKTYKKNLDKLVENTIRAKKIEDMNLAQNNTQKKGFFGRIFSFTKWNVAFLTSFIAVLFFGGIAMAAVPQFREAIFPTKGEISINSEPQGASVYIRSQGDTDYSLLGETPLSESLEPGDYEMKLKLESYEPYLTDFSLEVGESYDQDVKLSEEKKALDLIKEWKTYTDLEEEFEFKYPLSWEFEHKVDQKKSFGQIEITGMKSKIIVYKEILDFEKNPSKISYEGNEYDGIKNYKNWNYVVFRSFVSDDRSNLLKVAFFTDKKENLSIFEFVSDSVSVYDKEKIIENQKEWMLYNNSSIGFSMKYPVDWEILKKAETSDYAQVDFRPKNNSGNSLSVIYTEKYYDRMADFRLYERGNLINGYDVRKYCTSDCTGEVLYEFPNRFYVLYNADQDADIVEKYEDMIQTFSISPDVDDYYQNIVDYTYGYEVTIRNDDIYVEENVEEDFFDVKGVTIREEASMPGRLRVYKWDDIDDKWDEFVESLNLESATVYSKKILIDGQIYYRNIVWDEVEGRKGEYYIKKVIYSLNSMQEGVEQVDPRIQVSEDDLVVMWTPGVQLGADIKDVRSGESDVEGGVEKVDAIVGSLRRIVYK